MPDWTLFQWVIASFTAAALIVALLALRWPRRPDSGLGREIRVFEPHQFNEFPAIHATSGVPSITQLMERLQLDAKRSLVAQRRYELGLAQFNHYVNNRDGVIENARSQMASLARTLSYAEICKADEIGKSLTANQDQEQEESTQTQYRELSPQAQIYAQHKRRETETMRRIARDLETDTPRTDYTLVKARIASGNVKLDSIVSELPILWQDIRTLDQKTARPKIERRPPKRELLHLRLMTRERGLLEDKHAEKDGNWIVSKRYGIVVPYQAPVSIRAHVKDGVPPVRNGQAVVITQARGSEWDTEYWRKGGRLDQVYLRAKNGMDPEQLRSAYRWRLITRAAWVAVGVDIILFVALLVLARAGRSCVKLNAKARYADGVWRRLSGWPEKGSDSGSHGDDGYAGRAARGDSSEHGKAIEE